MTTAVNDPGRLVWADEIIFRGDKNIIGNIPEFVFIQEKNSKSFSFLLAIFMAVHS